MQMTKKRDPGDYFKKRRARLKAEREALRQKVAGEWHPTKARNRLRIFSVANLIGVLDALAK